jgi:hypothetical protein
LASNAEPKARDSPIRVSLETSGVRLPLRVAGDNVVFSELDRAVEQAIEAHLAASRELVRRRGSPPLELTVELVQARAELTDGRLLVELTTRATLRELAGVYLAQSHPRASAAGSAGDAHGVSIVRQAADTLGQKVADFVATALPS